MLGRSLDELAPQTRRLLGLLETKVRGECAKRAMEASSFLFSRRDVREWTGWGDTQLKIHLGRLADMEYLAMHRNPRHMQGFFYELLYDGAGEDGRRFLFGLLDAGTLSDSPTIHTQTPTYDENRAGQKSNRSGGGRPPVGGVSGGGRDEEMPAKADGKKVYVILPFAEGKNEQAVVNAYAS